MKTYRILSAILTQILFAIITVILVYGIFEKDWIISMIAVGMVYDWRMQ